MNYEKFVDWQIKEIKRAVGQQKALSVLSGGVDSSVVTILASKAIGSRLKTVFIDSGLMRENEPKSVARAFKKLGIKLEIINGKNKFLRALKGKAGPEEKRKIISNVFYRDIFGKIVKKSKIKFLLQGTTLTDIEETVAGIKLQHNVLNQTGISPEKKYGYKIIEPLAGLRKNQVRQTARFLCLPKEIEQRIPFPGPGFAVRIIGPITGQKISLIRQATAIVEKELKNSGAFQYFPVLMEDRATGVRNGKRNFGNIIIIRCVESVDARKALLTKLPWQVLHRIAKKITFQAPQVSRVCYDITAKPPATIEYI